MTPSERIGHAIRDLTSPKEFIYDAMRAGLDQAVNGHEEWGQGVKGFARRYGSGYAQYFISETLTEGSAYFLHEDNRYFRSGKQGFGPKFRYAITSTLLTRHDDGSRSISISTIGGVAGAAFISRIWQPRSTSSAGDAAVSFGLTIMFRSGLNLLREFSPGLAGKVLK